MIVVLAGGVGAARFLQGLVQVVPQNRLTVIVNTGDDRDFATHIHRTNLLRQGKTLSEVTENLRLHFGLDIRMLPMSDQPATTHIQTPVGLLHFQEYMVKRHCADEVQDVLFVGASEARPAPGVLDAIKDAEAILIAPSNPIVSIGSILAVPGIHDALHEASGMVVAVSPIVGGAPIKGPADKLMSGLGIELTPAGVARCYRDFLDVMVIDEQDAHFVGQIEDLGIPTVVTNTIMRDQAAKATLARGVLEATGINF